MILIEVFKAIILGVIEGITEWLPISSTGHMILANEFIKLNMTEAFKEMFFVVVQLGAIMSVVVLYFNKLNPFSFKKSNVEKRETLDLWLKVIVGVLPAVIIGGLFDDILNSMFYNYQIVSITLILYGVLFIVIENRNKNKEPKIKEFSHLTYKTSILIGMFQVLALIPGTSRSGATIIGAMLLGTSRYIATEYTFFLAIPIMFGASVLKLLKFGLTFNTLEVLVLGSGMATAYVVSILSIKFLVGYIKKNDFKAFGYYRIALGIVVLLWFMLKF